MPTDSSTNRRSQWDAGRFFATLNTFGEIPFLGSIRWLQQWFGQSPTFQGMDIDIRNSAVMVVARSASATGSTEIFAGLQKKCPQLNWSLVGWPSARSGEVFGEDAEVVAGRQGDFFRRALQAADAVVLLDVPAEGMAGDAVADMGLQVLQETLISVPVFDFSATGCGIEPWGALDDVVMGGVSQGSFFLKNAASGLAVGASSSGPNLEDVKAAPNGLSVPGSAGQSTPDPAQRAVFAGQVSTDNSGGFSSIRTRNFEPPFSFVGAKGMRLRVCGDGQRYKFILRNSPGWDSPAYIYGFDTVAGQWITVDIPFADMVPTFRARSLPDAASFSPAKVFSFQLMLSKFEYDRRLNPAFRPGPFELEVESLNLYRLRNGGRLIVVGATDAEGRSQQQAMVAAAGVESQWIDPQPTETNVEESQAALIEAIAAALAPRLNG